MPTIRIQMARKTGRTHPVSMAGPRGLPSNSSNPAIGLLKTRSLPCGNRHHGRLTRLYYRKRAMLSSHICSAHPSTRLRTLSLRHTDLAHAPSRYRISCSRFSPSPSRLCENFRLWNLENGLVSVIFCCIRARVRFLCERKTGEGVRVSELYDSGGEAMKLRNLVKGLVLVTCNPFESGFGFCMRGILSFRSIRFWSWAGVKRGEAIKEYCCSFLSWFGASETGSVFRLSGKLFLEFASLRWWVG